MKIAIMQPYFFPYIGYWQLLNAVDTFVIYDDVNYIKKGFINRNSILLFDKPYRFTLELQKTSQNKQINKIQIGSNKDKLLKMLVRAYGKAPYFDDVYPILIDILKNNEKNLARFIVYSIIKIAKFLGIETKIIYASEIEKDCSLKGEEKIINIAKRLGASHYINPIGGKEMYNREKFKNENIQLDFLSVETVKYKQFKNEFFPNLSILDIIMFNEKQQLKDMLERYKLI